MNKRYQVEELVAVGPDDGEWQPSMDFDDVGKAEEYAKSKIVATPHGESGVRVYDTVDAETVWTNCYL